ncbi:MAG: hypothetical protein Q8Q07_02235 [Dehalococcoidales bacterium]|nr:hypothetical protein [Dehalococcoidales bacterium]
MLRTTPLATQRLNLSLGGIIFSLVSNCSPDLTLSYNHEAFVVSGGEPDVLLQAEYGSVPDLEFEDALFQTNGVWRLFKSGGKLVYYFHAWELDDTPYKIAVMEPDFQAGTIYSRATESKKDKCFSPLNYPLDELLIAGRLSRGNGILVHACGVECRGRGLLFLGTSGAGKTTLSRLWDGESGITIFSDDRIIVRDMGDSYQMYGTPWHGDAEIASPLSVPLESIFFLVHDQKNRLTPVQPVDAASRILVRSFPTFWDAGGMDYTLGLCERLSSKVPCFELGFLPDKRVIDLLR